MKNLQLLVADLKKLFLGKIVNLTNFFESLLFLTHFYWAKGYTLNRIGDIITSNLDFIAISWENPRKQTFEDKKRILIFKISKLRKFYKFYRKRYNVFISFIRSLLDFYSHFYENDSYCLNAQKQYRISKKNERRISESKKKYQ